MSICHSYFVNNFWWVLSTGLLWEVLGACLVVCFLSLNFMTWGKRVSFSSRDPNHCTGAHRTLKQNSAQQRVRTKHPSMMRAIMSQRRCHREGVRRSRLGSHSRHQPASSGTVGQKLPGSGWSDKEQQRSPHLMTLRTKGYSYSGTWSHKCPTTTPSLSTDPWVHLCPPP